MIFFRPNIRIFRLLALGVMLPFSLPAGAGEGSPTLAALDDKAPNLTVPYVPTPQIIVDKMLELANVSKDDVIYDLGCGDGRIVVTAAKKYGAKGVGVDLDPLRIEDSKKNVAENKVEGLVEIRKGDVLTTDVRSASVVMLYLLPEVNLQLKPILQRDLKPGSRIVSHDFDMGDWKPKKTVTMKDEYGVEHEIYLWEIEKPTAISSSHTKKGAGEPAE